ncbi:MAG: tyrosine-type recombinase/integrase [Saprospiraceae bacterium]|nr:tyrosine-type recombinase/integrase [Saprospiraceae bacterium]
MLTQFLVYLEKEKRYSSHTVNAYHTDLHQFKVYLELQYSILNLNEVKYNYVRSWIASLSIKSIDNRSIHRKISSLKSYYNWAIRYKYIDQSPIEKVISPKLKKRLPEVIQKREVQELFDLTIETDDFETLRNSLIMSLFYQCGLRRAELIGLKLSDIQQKTKTLKVIGKGNKERVIPFGNELLGIILRYINKRNELDSIEGDFLILTKTGEKSYPKLIYRVVNQSLQQKTTIKKKSPHSLRHSFATHLADNGAELNAIKNLLGHSSLAATQVYMHLSIENVKNSYMKAHPRANLETKKLI